LIKKNVLEKYLSEVIGNQTRQNTLKIATLLHDIAKTDVLVKRPDGTAVSRPWFNCSRKSKEFCRKIWLESKAESYVERIVRYHVYLRNPKLMIANQDKEKYFRIFNETVGDIAIELTLLMHADLLVVT